MKPDLDHTTCFIQTHGFSGIISQPCNGIPVVLFEDLTNIHNKTLVSATSLTLPPCTATFIIETKKEVITRDIPPTGLFPGLSVQVEDLKRVSLVCRGNPGGVCDIEFTIAKSFPLCCSSENHSKKTCECAKKENNQSACFVDRHSSTTSVNQPCNGIATVLYNNRTENKNVTAISATGTAAPCQAILIIETKKRTIEKKIPNINPNLLTIGNFNLQVEDVRRISVRCEGNPAGRCTVSVGITTSFCICGACKRNKKKA